MNDRLLNTLLVPEHLLQIVALALSIFNLVAFLWLAFTVWLNGVIVPTASEAVASTQSDRQIGKRRSAITYVGVVGLSLSALFFFIHTLLISGPIAETSSLVTPDFLWHLIWFPALGVPYIWFMIGLHYAALINTKWLHRRPLLLAGSAILGCSAMALLILNRATFTFSGTLRLLAYDDVSHAGYVGWFSPLILLPVLFLCYVAFCAIGPWFTPGRVARLLRALWKVCTGRKTYKYLYRNLADAFWDDHVNIEQMDEPMLSWHLARPGLLFAALLMVGLTTSLGILAVWSMVRWLALRGYHNLPTLPPPVLSVIPFNLELLDIYATGSVAFIVLLIGYSVVRHGILIERPLGHRGFFEQWRGIVIVTTMTAIFIALLVILTRSSLGGMLLITCIATGTYALFTWSSYTAHDHYIALLGPFLRSTNMRHWLNTDLQKTEQSMETLFSHLCRDILEVQCARLVVLAGPVRRNFDYRWSSIAGLDAVEMQAAALDTLAHARRELRPYDIHPYSDYAQITTFMRIGYTWQPRGYRQFVGCCRSTMS